MDSWDDAWRHCKWLYEHTDRAYTEAAAKFYEELQPLILAGLRLKVEAAINRKEQR